LTDENSLFTEGLAVFDFRRRLVRRSLVMAEFCRVRRSHAGSALLSPGFTSFERLSQLLSMPIYRFTDDNCRFAEKRL
jgi:hypothetical protein